MMVLMYQPPGDVVSSGPAGQNSSHENCEESPLLDISSFILASIDCIPKHRWHVQTSPLLNSGINIITCCLKAICAVFANFSPPLVQWEKN